MLRGIKHLVARADLHNVARIHNRDAVGYVGNHAKVMGDVNRRKLIFLLQLADQVQDLSLNRYVKRGSRLIADEDFRGCRPWRWR